MVNSLYTQPVPENFGCPTRRVRAAHRSKSAGRAARVRSLGSRGFATERIRPTSPSAANQSWAPCVSVLGWHRLSHGDARRGLTVGVDRKPEARVERDGAGIDVRADCGAAPIESKPLGKLEHRRSMAQTLQLRHDSNAAKVRDRRANVDADDADSLSAEKQEKRVVPEGRARRGGSDRTHRIGLVPRTAPAHGCDGRRPNRSQSRRGRDGSWPSFAARPIYRRSAAGASGPPRTAREASFPTLSLPLVRQRFRSVFRALPSKSCAASFRSRRPRHHRPSPDLAPCRNRTPWPNDEDTKQTR